MAETWANGLDLHLDLSGTRIRAQMETALRDAIRSGRLAPGTRLPSTRTLAADLRVARNTVAEVYSQLVAEGWLAAQTGSGTSVASRAVEPPGPDPAVAAVVSGARYDLRSGEPDLSAFPRGGWLAAARKALATSPDAALGYGDPRGLVVLRGVLADYLARTRGVVVRPGGTNIVICSGFAQALAVVSRALLATGTCTLGVEWYGHQAHRDIAVRQGLRVVPIPVDGSGAVVGAAMGPDTIGPDTMGPDTMGPDTMGPDAPSAGAVLLTPAHQFPLGVTLAPERRRAIAEWGGFIIEDDYDGEFRYDRQPVGAMQALAPDRVVYCGTASKSLAPGVRLAWLVVPPRLLDAVTMAIDGGPSALDQLAMAEFITSGGYDRQIRRTRLAYRRRRDRLVAALAPLGLKVSGIAAGLHVLLDLPQTTSELRVETRASWHGLALEGLRRYAFDECPDRTGLVIGYARPAEHAYTTALARLCAVLNPLEPAS